MSWRALTVVLAVVVSVCAFPRNGGDNRTATQIVDAIISAGYPAELHHVTTEDGYILGVHRIPYGKDGPSAERRPVVFLMHGLMGWSANFIHIGSDYAIAYNLADAGFDVWLGNARGTTYSRAHVSLNPDDNQEKQEFFDFSWEEIATIDLPTMIDYALTLTGESKLHYIGHSQGGTTFLVLNSMKPEYNEKFYSAHLLAGVGYQSNFPNTALRTTALMTNSLYALGTSLGLVEIRGLDDLPFSLSRQGHTYIDNCFGDLKYKAYCEMLGLEHIVALLLKVGYVEVFPSESGFLLSSSYTVEDLVKNCLNSTQYQNFCEMLHSSKVLGTDGIDRSWFAGGGAVKELVHYGQNVRLKQFCRWDYGTRNEQVYGTKDPPNYDLGLVTVNTTLHFGMGDNLVDYTDVADMANDMPNAQTRKVARADFGHSDFTDAFDAKELVYDYIIEALLYFERDTKSAIVEKKSPVYLSVINTPNWFTKNNSNSFASVESDSPITMISSFTTRSPNLSQGEVDNILQYSL